MSEPTGAQVMAELDRVVSTLDARRKSAVSFEERSYWVTHLESLRTFRMIARSQEFADRCRAERPVKQGGKNG